MGMDLLDLSFRIEQRFGIDLAPDGQAWAEFGWSPDNPDGRPFEFTVGQIYEFLLARMEIVDEGESRSGTLPERRTWMPSEVWDALEQILMECLCVDQEDVRPAARLVADLGAD